MSYVANHINCFIFCLYGTSMLAGFKNQFIWCQASQVEIAIRED